MCQHVHFAGKRSVHDELLALIDERVNIGDLADEPQVESSKSELVFLVDEDSVHQVREIVAAGAIDRPLIWELLAGFEDLLHDCIQRMPLVHPVVLGEDLLDFEGDTIFGEGWHGLRAIDACCGVEQLQTYQVLPRVEHAVAVVNAHAGDDLFRQKAAQHAMSCSKHPWIFHAQSHKLVYVEEAAIVDLLARNAPVSKSIHLKLKQQMQQIKAARIGGGAIDVLQRALKKLLHRGRFLQQRLPAWTQVLPNSTSLFTLFWVGAAVLR